MDSKTKIDFYNRYSMRFNLRIFLLLIPILMGSISLNKDSQEPDPDYVPLDTTRVLTSTWHADVILEEFVVDAIINDLDSSEVREHINRLDLIMVGEFIDNDIWGYNLLMEDSLSSTGLRGCIFINQLTLVDYKFFRLTVYHELGHWFGLDHCNCESKIMMDYKYDAGVFILYKNWDKEVSVLMDDINKKYNEETSRFDLPDSLFIP